MDLNKTWIKKPPDNYKVLKNKLGEEYFVHNMSSVSELVEVGKYTYIHGTTRITTDKIVRIGNFCSIASEVRIQVGDNHDYHRISTFPFKTVLGIDTDYDETSGATVNILNDVWIGESVRILSGSQIGNGVVIGAGSVIKGNLLPYGIYVGNPAQLIKMRFQTEIIEFLETLKWWNWSLSKIELNSSFFSLNLRDCPVSLNELKNMII